MGRLYFHWLSLVQIAPHPHPGAADLGLGHCGQRWDQFKPVGVHPRAGDGCGGHLPHPPAEGAVGAVTPVPPFGKARVAVCPSLPTQRDFAWDQQSADPDDV